MREVCEARLLGEWWMMLLILFFIDIVFELSLSSRESRMEKGKKDRPTVFREKKASDR